jgi:uncharacterized protein
LAGVSAETVTLEIRFASGNNPLLQPADQPPEEPFTRSQVLIAMGLTAILWLIAAKIWLQTPFSGGLMPLRWQPLHLVIGLGGGGAIILVSGLIFRFWPAYRAAATYYLQLVLQPLLWPDLIWLGLLPGLSEELLFRGVMLPAIGLNWLGITLSSLCFGVLHLTGREQWPYMLWATLVGVFLATITVATDNLLVPIVAHILTNLLASGLWKLNHPVDNSPHRA